MNITLPILQYILKKEVSSDHKLPMNSTALQRNLQFGHQMVETMDMIYLLSATSCSNFCKKKMESGRNLVHQ